MPQEKARGSVSIYQVPIKGWFCDPESPFNGDLHVVEAALNAGATCESCGEPVTMELGYCSHGIAYGFGEMYCCAKCAGYDTAGNEGSTVVVDTSKAEIRATVVPDAIPCESLNVTESTSKPQPERGFQRYRPPQESFMGYIERSKG